MPYLEVYLQFEHPNGEHMVTISLPEEELGVFLRDALDGKVDNLRLTRTVEEEVSL